MPAPDIGNVTVGDIYSVDVFGLLDGQRIINTFAYKVTTAPSATSTRWDGYETLVRKSVV